MWIACPTLSIAAFSDRKGELNFGNRLIIAFLGTSVGKTGGS